MSIRERASLPQETSSIEDVDAFFVEGDALADLSNSVVDLIDEGKLDEAEIACNELMRLYPDQVDGLERFAMVYEARGEKEKAVEYYNKTAEFARCRKGFDPRFVDWALAKARHLSD